MYDSHIGYVKQFIRTFYLTNEYTHSRFIKAIKNDKLGEEVFKDFLYIAHRDYFLNFRDKKTLSEAMVIVYNLGIEYKGSSFSKETKLTDQILNEIINSFIEKKELKSTYELLNSIYRIGILAKSWHDFYVDIKDFAHDLKRNGLV